jgi:hypothetical protein
MLTYFYVATLADTLNHLKYWARDNPKDGAQEQDEMSDCASEDEDHDYPAGRAGTPSTDGSVRSFSPAFAGPCKESRGIVQEPADRDLNSEDGARREAKNLRISKSTDCQASGSHRRVAISSPNVTQVDHWESKGLTRKRTLDKTNNTNSRGARADGHHVKQQKGIKFSCPYRKRNPVAFNVRTYRTCALMSFPNLAELK